MADLAAAEAFTGHWAGCDWCQEGLPCPEGDPLWTAMNLEAGETDG
jgi:hypothetical protein